MTEMVDLAQMLDARERRAQRQREVLDAYGLPLISFTMNIAGPVKNGPEIRQGFRIGRRILQEQLRRMRVPIVFSEEVDEVTGCEMCCVVRGKAEDIKRLTCEIEEKSRLGRLFDMDVLSPDGTQLMRDVPRKCLICGKPAKECARSRTHTVEELQAKTKQLLEEAIAEDDAMTAASLAVRSLLDEVCTTPKPGLVDRNNSGSHDDMDIFTFMSSASVLWPYFQECVRIGRESRDMDAPETFQRLRWPGKMAEGHMLRATSGVNTHKGAIFSMGLLCGALGRLERDAWRQPERVLREIASMTAGTIQREMAGLSQETAESAGQKLYVEYGVRGVRGQAEDGFPTVIEYGMPVLEEGLRQGRSLEEAGRAAMLALLAHTDDTNMISRGGMERQKEKAEELRALLEKEPYPDEKTLKELDAEYIKEHLSPGGSADLLAICYMLHFLQEKDET